MKERGKSEKKAVDGRRSIHLSGSPHLHGHGSLYTFRPNSSIHFILNHSQQKPTTLPPDVLHLIAFCDSFFLMRATCSNIWIYYIIMVSEKGQKKERGVKVK